MRASAPYPSGEDRGLVASRVRLCVLSSGGVSAEGCGCRAPVPGQELGEALDAGGRRCGRGRRRARPAGSTSLSLAVPISVYMAARAVAAAIGAGEEPGLPAEGNRRGHSAHIGQEVEVHYRWHALYGRRVRCQRSEQRGAGPRCLPRDGTRRGHRGRGVDPGSRRLRRNGARRAARGGIGAG